MPDVDELSCEPCTACGHPKALHRSQNGACFAEPNRTRPSHSAIEDVEQRKKFGVECWCRSYEGNISAGIEAVLKYGDTTGLKTAADAAVERGDQHGAERVLDCYVRKTPQNERDAAWISATERSIARSHRQNSGIHNGHSTNHTAGGEIQPEQRAKAGIVDDSSQDAVGEHLFEEEEGPGSAGIAWFHTREYIRDLSKDALLPAAERERLRAFYTQRENLFHAKLVFFEKKEKVERWKQALGGARRRMEAAAQSHQVDALKQVQIQTAEKECFEAKEKLAKAQVELRTATAQLRSFSQNTKVLSDVEASARKWRLTRKWEAITPDELKPAVEAIRHIVEHYGFWQSKWSTEKLCYAALHPTDSSIKDAKAADDLRSYRRFLVGLLGRDIEQQLLTSSQPPPLIFDAYREVLQAAMKLLTRRGFHLMLAVAEENERRLNVHPVEWTKRQFEILISAEKSAIRSWIMGVCDPLILSATHSTDDSIYAGNWRAPRLIYMSPAGNGQYDPEAAWSREGLVKSQQLLEALAHRMTTFLNIELDEIAGEAHIRSVMGNTSRVRVEEPVPNVKPFATESVMPPAVAPEPNFWRSMQQSFRTLSHEELSLLKGYSGDRRLRACGNYQQSSSYGEWSLSEGLSEGLRERFEVEATRGGLGLTLSSEEDPMTVWLHHLFQDLLEKNSKFLFCASKEGGTILQACEASAIYCARLEKEALLASKKGTPLAMSTAGEPATPPSSTPESRIESQSTREPIATRQTQVDLDKVREAVIQKVQNPQKYTVLTVNEACSYFSVRPRTVHRWVHEGKLRSGGRRGSITVESVSQWQKKRSRKRRVEQS